MSIDITLPTAPAFFRVRIGGTSNSPLYVNADSVGRIYSAGPNQIAFDDATGNTIGYGDGVSLGEVSAILQAAGFVVVDALTE